MSTRCFDEHATAIGSSFGREKQDLKETVPTVHMTTERKHRRINQFGAEETMADNPYFTEEVLKSLQEKADRAAIPIDFEQLIEDGVLEKKSGKWYAILKYDDLPLHAREKIIAIQSPNLVRFTSHEPSLAGAFR